MVPLRICSDSAESDEPDVARNRFTLNRAMMNSATIEPPLDADHDVADLLARLDVAIPIDDLVQAISPVDDRLELS